MPTEYKRLKTELPDYKPPASPRDWNQRRQRPPVLQWLALTVLLALMAYLFVAL